MAGSTASGALRSPRRWASTWPGCRRKWTGPEVRVAIQENAGLGDKLGLTGTPAFIIGEEVIPGAVGLDPLKQVVANTRQCGKATC